MVTLTVITIPIEILFLCTLRAFGWLKLPIIFAILSVIFFCCAVSFMSALPRCLLKFTTGLHIISCSSVVDQFLVVQRPGPRYIRSTHPLCPDGSDRTITPRTVFRDRLDFGHELVKPNIANTSH